MLEKAHFPFSLKALYKWNLEEPKGVVYKRSGLGPKYYPTLLRSYLLINDSNRVLTQ